MVPNTAYLVYNIRIACIRMDSLQKSYNINATYLVYLFTYLF